MIIIDFLQEEAFGEPGPNLVWRGFPSDFLIFAMDVHAMICTGKNLRIENSDSFILNGKKDISFIIVNDSQSLVKIEKNSIVTALSKRHWEEVFHLILTITFGPGHNYIEFDDIDLIEDANWIIDSIESK